MSSIDPNSPTIEIGIDSRGAEQGLKSLDQAFDNSIQKMNEKLSTFENNLKNVFGNLQKLQGNTNGLSEESPTSTSTPSSSNASNASNSSEKEERLTTERKDDDAKKRQLEYERLRLDQGRRQLEQGKENIAALKDMGVALGRAVTGGMGMKAMFDFAHQTSRLETFLKSINVNPVQGMVWKNVLNNKGIEDGEVWQAMNSVAKAGRSLQWHDPDFWKGAQGHAYSVLSMYDPNLLAATDRKGKPISGDQRMLMLKNAAEKLKKDKSGQYTDDQKTDIVTSALGGESRGIATQFYNGTIDSRAFQKGSKEWKKADDYVKTFPELKKADAAVQDLKNTFSVNFAKALANITPAAVDLMKGFDGFVSKHGEIAATGAALLTIATAFKGLSGTLRFILGAGTALSGGAAARGGVGGAVAAGLIPRAAGPVALALALGGDTNETPEQKEEKIRKFKEAQAQIKASADRALTANAGKVNEIQKAINGKIQFDDREGRLILIDKNGNRIMYVDDLSMTAGQIIQKAKDAQAPSMWNPLNWGMIPQAHADTPSYDVTGGRTLGSRNTNTSPIKYSGDKMSIARQIRDEYKKAGFQDWHAEAAITNMMRESGGDPNAVGDHGHAFGLFQWQKPRQRDFLRLFGHPIQQSTPLEQIKFNLWELQHSKVYKRAGDAFKNAQDFHSASRIFVKQYEQSARQEDDIRKNATYLPFAQRAMQGQSPRQPLHEMQLQQRTNQIIHDNRAATGGAQTNHINVNVASGDPHQIANVVDQKLKQLELKKGSLSFAKMNALTGVSGNI